MIRNRKNSQTQATEERRSGPSFDVALPESVRLDRYGRAIAGSVPVIVQRLPRPDEAREAIVSTTQRALESLPGRKPKRRGPPRLVLLLGIAGLVGVGFVVYRRFTRRGAEELEWSSSPVNPEWPAKPSTGDTHQGPESDAQAEVDAEQAAEVLDRATPPVGVTGSTPGA